MQGLACAPTAHGHDLADDAECNFFRSRCAQVKARRRADSRDLFGRKTLRGEVVEHESGTMRAGHQSHVGGVSAKSFFEPEVVILVLRGNDDEVVGANVQRPKGQQCISRI